MSGRAWGRAAALALLIFTAVCGQAWAAAGQMTGTVTDEATHAAIQGVDVTVYDSNEQYVASTPTSAAGGYTLSGLAPGVYEVGFDDGTGVHASEFYNDRKSCLLPTQSPWRAGRRPPVSMRRSQLQAASAGQ